jgi:glycyl-tRNA synthetase (class II)
VCETFKTLVHAPGMSGSRRNCRFENRIGAGSIGKAHRRREDVGAVGITVDHQPREDNTVAHRDRLRRQRVVFGRDYRDGDADVRGDSV